MTGAHPAAVTAGRPGPLAAFLAMGRFKFLFQSLLVVGFGSSLAVHGGARFTVGWYLVTVAFAWCAHLMTHYCNEYFDLEADRANDTPTSWTGGSRVLVRGFLDPIVSLSAAFVLLFLAIVPIVYMPGVTSRTIALLILLLAWFYTAPPLRLNYHALGEITCASVLYALGPVLAFSLQTPRLSGMLFSCVGIVFVLQFLRCLIMNLSDIEGDLRVGKKTQAGVLTRTGVARVYAAGQLATYAALIVAAVAGPIPPVTAAIMAVTLPVPLWVVHQVHTGAMGDARRANQVTLWSSLHMPLMSTAIIVGLVADMAAHGRDLPVLWLVCCGVSLALFAVWVTRTLVLGRRS